MKYPFTRPRRLRQNPYIREMVKDCCLELSNLIQPLFITEQATSPIPIRSMPNIYRLSPEWAVEEAKILHTIGIKTLALFPNISPEKKSSNGKEAYNDNGLIQQTIKRIKDVLPDIQIMADVALDPYTTHGHDGLIDKKGHILNDQTIEILVQQALSLTVAGADIIAPSDMMDGRIGAIRKALETSSFNNTLILSYCVKYASSLYSPFREGVSSSTTLQNKDKKTYQMDIRNFREAMTEAFLDISEGADILMVKPGLPYLDILNQLRYKTNHPLAAYHTSGEYAMQKNAIEKGFIAEESIEEILTAFKRSGADIIVTYFAKEFAQKNQ